MKEDSSLTAVAAGRTINRLVDRMGELAELAVGER